MPDTLTIRLSHQAREILERAARRKGTGASALVREIAEAEARRLRKAEAKAEGQRIVAYIESHPKAREELYDYGTPLRETP